MAKFGFNDDELQKLFADAGAVVKKVKTTPQHSADEAPAADSAPVPVEEHQAQSDHQPAPVRKEEPSGGPLKTAQVIGGTLEEAQFQAMLHDKSVAAIPWKAVRSLVLGRVEDQQIVAWLHGSTVYFISDKKVSYKGLITEVAPMATLNWRSLLTELSSRLSLTADLGIQALGTSGGFIPKYQTADELFKVAQKLA